MANDPHGSDTREALILIGVLTGFCLFVGAAVMDLSLQTAERISAAEQSRQL